MLKTLLPFCLVFAFHATSQQNPPGSGKPDSSLPPGRGLAEHSLVKNIRFSNIGPSVMSGRVTDIDVNPANPIEFYVAYASGGLWYTANNGTSFLPVLDHAETQNIGDIAVDWNSSTLWVGTGENNASRSSYAGIGILKSTDKGKSWDHMGLGDSHHIGRILINPRDPRELVVGVTGHLYTPNSERGIYKTSDGGRTWHQKLFIDEETGIIDLVQVPGNFDILFAATWEKDRKAWNFRGSGRNSGIYRSTDAGETWAKISGNGSGFPEGDGVGRIGLDAFDGKTIYALLDNQGHREKSAEDEVDGLSKEMLRTMDVNTFLDLEDDMLNKFLKSHGFQEKYTATGIKGMVRDGRIQPVDLVTYLEDANRLLFETPVIGAEIYRSEDGGDSWTKMNREPLDDLYYSYGYYFGQIRVSPLDREKIYAGGVPLIRSDDGGRTFTSIGGDNVHADHHALWVNPKKAGHLINGNDGGVNITYDDGAHWIKNNNPPVGQFYAIAVDLREPYRVYGGLQDNGVWVGPHRAEEGSLWHQTGHYSWKSILGGDGMQVQVDPCDPNTVYTGYQFGNYFRLDLETEEQTPIQPRHEIGEKPLRFNWQSPILLSSHHREILYMGSNEMHRSMNRGEDWVTISGDLTRGGKKGNVAYGTITTLDESPFEFGLLYSGSDDGLIYRSEDSGARWENISRNIGPWKGEHGPGLWVSRIRASAHKKERVYASLNGYREDDFNVYLYRSEDYGETWTDIGNGIPPSPVNVILEDPVNENLLFAGTDSGLFVTLDGGAQWEWFQAGLPRVAIHDLVIQPEARHLLAGTHGRSIYKTGIGMLQDTGPVILKKPLHLYTVDTLAYSENWGNPPDAWTKADTPGIDFVFYAGAASPFSAVIATLDGVEVSATDGEADRGFNILSFDVAFSKKGKQDYLKKYKKKLREAKDGKTYLPPGTYEVEIRANGASEKMKFTIE